MECQLEDIAVYYEIHGEGRPILMLHGFWPDHHIMAGCMAPIFNKRDGWQRIYLDLPGMGKTKGPDWLVNSDQMLQVVLDFIDAILPGRHFTLAGLSYGAYLARGILHHRAAMVDGLAMIVPLIVPSFADRDVPEHVTLVHDEGLIASLSPEGKEEVEGYYVVQSRQIWERTEAEVGVGVAAADEPFLDRLQGSGYSFSFDPDAGSEQFEKPALLVMGRQDSVVGYRDAWGLIKKYPRASFAVLDRAGHNLQIEQEALFNCLVNEWLNRLEDEVPQP